MDRMNDNMKAGHKMQSLTLLSHVVRRQPSWLHKIVQAPLFMSLLNCLKVIVHSNLLGFVSFVSFVSLGSNLLQKVSIVHNLTGFFAELFVKCLEIN